MEAAIEGIPDNKIVEAIMDEIDANGTRRRHIRNWKTS
jgi:hypothetical protein